MEWNDGGFVDERKIFREITTAFLAGFFLFCFVLLGGNDFRDIYFRKPEK